MSSVASDSLEFCSMDYWDYFVELECLQNSKGKDLQLAAELGKTLLERNKELETGLKQQQTVIDDQNQEIEYLSKQSVALREVNDSRLRVYEQLEVSIQELEVTNQRLQDEAVSDKKRIRSLVQTVECLESRAAELQTLVEDLRRSEQAHRAAATAAAAAAAATAAAGTASSTAAAASSSQSADQQGIADGRRDSPTKVPSPLDQLTDRVAILERQLTECRERERQERERRQWAEAEVSTAQEECSELRQEMVSLRERSVKLHTLAEEVHAMEEHRLSPFMRHCSPRASSVSPQMAAASAMTEAEHSQSHSVWGTQEPARWSAGTPATAPSAAEDAGSAPASLISDLDAHYRVLLDHMDKYEWLLTSRPPRPATPDQPSSLSLLEELQLSAAAAPPPPPPAPPRSAAAGLARDSGPASLLLLGAASDGDASSSGFSDGSEGSRAVSRATQTPDVSVPTAVAAPVSTVPPAQAAAVPPPLTAPGQRSFQHTPQYKQLFQEIFQVLKKPAAVMPESTTWAAGSPAPPVTVAAATEQLPAESGFSQAPAASQPAAEAAAASAATSQEVPPPRSAAVLASALEPQSTCEPMSLQATAPAEALCVAGLAAAAQSESAEAEPAPAVAAGGRSRAASAARTFSYTEEYERRLRASTPVAAAAAAVDGASEASPGGGSSGAEEFPLLVRPSEEVAKLRLLERSYAEALKAGRRCFHRPTLL